jgi:DNA-binding PadR family transcriptional regulator
MSTTKSSTSTEVKLKRCPCVGGTLDKLVQPAILALLAEGPIHGYRIPERLGTMPSFAGSEPDASGIYRLLKNMEGRGLVVSSWDRSQTGPAKRTYQMTPEGWHCLALWVKTLEDYRDRVTSLLKATRIAAKKGE